MKSEQPSVMPLVDDPALFIKNMKGIGDTVTVQVDNHTPVYGVLMPLEEWVSRDFSVQVIVPVTATCSVVVKKLRINLKTKRLRQGPCFSVKAQDVNFNWKVYRVPGTALVIGLKNKPSHEQVNVHAVERLPVG